VRKNQRVTASIRNTWEHFPHGADIGVRGVGPTKEAAFEQIALALTGVVTDPLRVRPALPVHVSCQAPSDDLLLVDWAEREAGWGMAITSWRDGAAEGDRPRIVLFGPHTDLESHTAARDAGLGPMRARSALFATLPTLVAESRSG